MYDLQQKYNLGHKSEQLNRSHRGQECNVPSVYKATGQLRIACRIWEDLRRYKHKCHHLNINNVKPFYSHTLVHLQSHVESIWCECSDSHFLALKCQPSPLDVWQGRGNPPGGTWYTRTTQTEWGSTLVFAGNAF